MATSHGIVFADAPLSTGTQDYTKASLGTVKGYLMLGSEDTPVNTNFADVQWHIGASDLAVANGVLIGGNYEDAQATSDAKTLMHATRLMGISDAGADAETEGCNHNATVTDGIQVDWTNVESAALCTALMFKEGIDNFDAQLVTLGGTGSSTVTPGFNPDIIIVVSAGQSAVSYGPQGISSGVQFYKQTSNTYAGMYFGAPNADTTPDSARFYTTAAIGGNVNSSNAALDNEYTLGNFTSTTFDATKVAQTADRVCMFISIKLATGYSASVGTITAPTSTGVESSITGLDHTPQLALFAATGHTAIDDGSDVACNFCFGACDADAEVTMGGWIEDAFGATQNTNAGGHHRDDSCIYIQDTGGLSVRSQANFSAFQTGGVDLDFTTANDAIKIAYLTIGADNSSSSGLSSRHALGRGISRGTARGIG